jgi:hypothetical protein
MFDTVTRLDLTSKDIELIEAALHTQKKILAVQSEAGGTGASNKLNDLKNLSRRIGKAQTPTKVSSGYLLTQFLRWLTCTDEACRQSR